MSNNRNYGRDSKTYHFKMPSFDKPTTQSTSNSNSTSKWQSLNTFQKHKQLLSHYPTQKQITKQTLTEADILKQNHVFIRDDDVEDDTWESRLAKKYYDRLFKEFGLVNLEKYKQNKLAIRWRVEQEVVSGKGQFICGNIKCDSKEELKAWEVPFSYVEKGEKKVALVKLKLCRECAGKLNYTKLKKEKERKKRKLEELDHSQDEDDHIENEANEDEESKKVEDESVARDQESELWKAPITIAQDQDDEDFDSYLNDMFK